MEPLTIFALQVLMSLFVYGLAARWYVAPWFARKPIHEALAVLVFPHAIRHLGLTFFVPGIPVETLPSYFSNAVAYGDFVSGLVAIVALFALRRRWAAALPIVAVFNVVGTVDLVNALSNPEVVPLLGAAWYIPTFWVPVLLVTHGMIYARLFAHIRRPATRARTAAASLS